MRLLIAAVGRLKAGPERELVARYMERLNAVGRGIALGPAAIIEIEESRARRPEERKAAEAQALLAGAGDGPLVVLDETGRTDDSEAFARRLGAWRDNGAGIVTFAIGGADGHGEALRGAASHALSFGAMTMPHQIVRIVLAEQLYRAATILSGHPYHRV